MSKKVKEALFDLVKSMTKSEKRYFKISASRHIIGSENNYVLLFDYLDKLHHYDESQLFEDFKGNAFLNKFSITKKRLYTHIMDALDGFHSSKSEEAKFYKMLHSIDILHSKSLYDQSKRQLDSLKKLAEKLENKEVLLICAKKERRYMETVGYTFFKMEDLELKNRMVENCTNDINVLSDLWTIKSSIFHRLRTKGIARSEEDIQVYNQFFVRLKASRVKANSSMLNYLLCHSLSAYYFAVGDKKRSLVEIKSAITYLKSGVLKSVEINKLFSLMTNAVYLSDELGEYEQSIEILNELKQTVHEIDKTIDLEVKLFSSISSLEIGLYLRKGEIDLAYSMIDEINNNILKYDESILPVRKAYLYFKIAVTLIAKGDFSGALRYVNSIINDSRLDKTEDIYGFTQLLDLLIHIELENKDLLKYALKNAQRFFKTRNRLYGFEKVVLSYIGKITRSDDHFIRIELWGELYSELQNITHDGFQNVAQEYFDFSAWAISKSSEKSFGNVIQERYLAKSIL